MLNLRTTADMQAAAQTVLDPALRSLLTNRMEQLSQGHNLDLSEVVHFLIIQPGDVLADIDAALGFPILANLVDGTVFGDPEWTPSFEWLQCHCGFFEIVFIFDDSGFGTIVLVQDHPGVPFDLHALCLEYQSKPEGP